MKKVLIGLGIILFLLVVTAFLIPFFVDINYLKPQIEKAIGEELNGKVELGKLELSIIQGLGIEVQGIKILNPPDFPQTPLLEVEQAKVYFGALRSLFGTPNVQITLTKPKIQIYENDKKELNSSKLFKEKPSETPTPTKTSPSVSFKEQLPKGFLGALILRSSVYVEIIDGEIAYFESNGTATKLQTIALNIGPLNLKDPLSFQFQASLPLSTKNNITLEGPINMKGTFSNPLISKEPFSINISSELDSLKIETPFAKKEMGEKLRIKFKGILSKENIVFENLSLDLPMGAVQLKGTLLDFKNPRFDIETSLQASTPKQETKEKSNSKKLQNEYDVSLKLSSKGTLTPFLMEEGEGDIDVQKLQGEIPSFLQPLFTDKKIMMEGVGSVRFKGHFQIKNNKPTRIDLKDYELDLTPLLLNFENKWSKPKGKLLRLKGNGIYEEKENEKNISLGATTLTIDDIALKTNGLIHLLPTPSIDLTLSTNTFSSDTLEKYSPPSFPIHFKGKLSLPSLTIKGDPTQIESLDIIGKLMTSEGGRLEFNPKFTQSKPWSSEGPILFSTTTSFLISKKKIKELSLDTKADLSQAALRFKNEFYKPAQIPLSFTLKASLKNNQLTLSTLNLLFHNLETHMKGTVSNFSSDTKKTCQLAIDSKPFSLSEWNQFFPSIKNKFLGTVEFKSIQLQLPLDGPKDLSLNGTLALHEVSGEIPQTLIQSKSVQIKGPFLVDVTSDVSYSKRKIQKLNILGKINLTDMDIHLKNTFIKPEKIPFTLDLNIQSQEDSITFKDTKLLLKETALDIQGSTTDNIHLQTSSVSLSEFSEFLPSLKKAPLTGNLRFETDLKGSLLDNTKPININFTLSSQALEYLPISKDQEEKEEKPIEKKTGKKPSSPPLSENPLLKRLTFNGKISLTKATYKTFKFWNVESKMTYKDKLLTIDPLQFDFYDGKFNAKTTLNLNKKDPVTDIEAHLQKLNMEKFLTAQSSKLKDKLSGSLDADMNVSMTGLEGEQIQKSMAGKGKTIIKNGHFKIFNLTEAIAGIPILNEVAPNVNLSDDFSVLQTSLIIKN